MLDARDRAADREVRRQKLHPDTLAVRNNLGHACHSAGRVTEAITLFEQTLAETEGTLGEHPSTLTVCKSLADAYHSAGPGG